MIVRLAAELLCKQWTVDSAAGWGSWFPHLKNKIWATCRSRSHRSSDARLRFSPPSFRYGYGWMKRWADFVLDGEAAEVLRAREALAGCRLTGILGRIKGGMCSTIFPGLGGEP
jgi:hypothetical protein